MRSSRLILNNLTFYLRKNLLLALGVAISSAVLTGALIVGDSVEYSLNRIVDQRLGNVTHVLTAGDRYFTVDLGSKLGEELQVTVSSILLQEGIAVAGGGQKRINHVQVLGIDDSFDRVGGPEDYYSGVSGDSVIISRNLSQRLDLSTGDEILLRIEKASLIPLNAPFVSDAESVVPFRAVIGGIADESQLGRFNLKVSQTAPFNVFMAQSRLARLMDFSGRVNVLLFSAEENIQTRDINSAIRENFSFADAGLKVKMIDDLQLLEIKSDRVFIDDVLSRFIQRELDSVNAVLTYFVNQLKSGNHATPYSFVSTVPAGWLFPNEIIINEWLADDLSAAVGDSITLKYFVMGPLRELSEETASFIVRSVVKAEGPFGDRNLMPDLPGLSDVGNCRDWQTGVPIDLELIRDKDEDYWDEYGGIPKAFISVTRATELWANRFGTYTALRIDAGDYPSGIPEASLMKEFDPALLGFSLEDSRMKGYEAAGNGVDFSQLFGGLSFFLLVAGILLMVLLFLLNLESRKEQLKTLVVLGIPVKVIRRILMMESMIVALVGSAAGLLLAVVYNRLVFIALNGVWKDIIRTEMMQIHIKWETLITGMVITLLVSFLAMFIPLSRRLKKQFAIHKETGGPGKRYIPLSNRKPFLYLFAITGIISFGLVGSQLFAGELVNVPVFFTAGGLLLLSGIFFFMWQLRSSRKSEADELDLSRLSWKNALRNPTRSVSIVILFAIGAFLVISTGSNRKDLFTNSDEPTSGTGGFLYYAESTIPVLRQLNDPEVRLNFGLEGDYSFVQLRKASGDDASCLNLNKIVNPQILGVDPIRLDGRYSFVTRTPLLDEEHPWNSLEQELPGGVIPAIADETAIKWGLGLEVGDTLHYMNSNGGTMELLLIGGLAPSVFQGNVIISNTRFLEQFPESSGAHVLLVEGETGDTAQIRSEMERGLRDYGLDMQLAAVRLAEFNSVTNTYLSIFLVMGALGLLLGTFGLGVILSRSIMERKHEFALLKAVGYGKKKIRRLVVREYMVLLLVGIGTGFAAAIIATLPSILSSNTGTSFSSILVWLGILILNGWIWIHLIARFSLMNESIYTSLRND